MSLGGGGTVDATAAGDGGGMEVATVNVLPSYSESSFGTSKQQLWPVEPSPASRTPADVKAAISPPQQEAAFFNPPAEPQAPLTFSKGQFSSDKAFYPI